ATSIIHCIHLISSHNIKYYIIISHAIGEWENILCLTLLLIKATLLVGQIPKIYHARLNTKAKYSLQNFRSLHKEMVQILNAQKSFFIVKRVNITVTSKKTIGLSNKSNLKIFLNFY
ncbi:hypothetical protein ACJX0J_029213, partial [Zea mays]